MKYFWIMLVLFLATPALANTHAIKLKKGHPIHYTVEPGDTLWGISAKFLADPLQWPELVEANPEIMHPGQIYPGQVLELYMADGHPKLRVHGGGTVKLSPKIHSQPLNTVIPTIPLETVRPFLNDSRVIAKDELKFSPYVLAINGEHVVAGEGGSIYVEGLKDAELGTKYSILRPGRIYLDPTTKRTLGYAADDIGKGEVIRIGNPATLYVYNSRSEILNGDKVVPIKEQELPQNYILRVPTEPVNAYIIGVMGGVTQIGQYQIIVLNIGSQGGLGVGDILAIYKTGKPIKNPHSEYQKTTITLPDERSGVLMIFRVFPQVSYGLVLYATQPLHVLDKIKNPRFAG